MKINKLEVCFVYSSNHKTQCNRLIKDNNEYYVYLDVIVYLSNWITFFSFNIENLYCIFFFFNSLFCRKFELKITSTNSLNCNPLELTIILIANLISWSTLWTTIRTTHANWYTNIYKVLSVQHKTLPVNEKFLHSLAHQ